MLLRVQFAGDHICVHWYMASRALYTNGIWSTIHNTHVHCKLHIRVHELILSGSF